MYKEEKYNIKRIIIEVLGTITGALIIAIGISQFLLPNQLSSGGISGIATITYYLLNIPMGLTIMLINIPLFIFSIIKLGIKFNLKTVFTTIILALFLEIFKYGGLIKLSNLDLFTSCVFGQF